MTIWYRHSLITLEKDIMKHLLTVIALFVVLSIQAQEEWELARDKENVKVWVKDFPDSNFKQFKSETTVEASLESIVALQLDIANMGKWYDNVGTVTPIEKVSEMEGIYVIKFDMPFPVLDRVSAIRAKMDYDKATKTVKIKTQYEPEILEDPDGIMVTNIQSIWEITDLGNGQIEIFHSGYMDPAGILPAWIGNTGVKDGPIKTFRGMMEILPEYANAKVDWLNN